MFRDLKEYQEIAKIYADKVSKPENLEERRGSSPEQLAANRKDAFKGVPNSASNKRAEMSKARRGDKKFEFKKPTGGAQGRTKRPEPEKSKLPSTAEIRASNQGRSGGGNAGGSTDSGGTAQMKNSTTFTKQGKQRTKAQMMAAARIAAQKASPMDRKLSGRERAQQMARDRIAAKKAEAQKF